MKKQKFAHISDLHLGKRLNEYSLLEDQKYIMDEIFQVIKDEKVTFLLISGDVYDKSIPPVEAVTIFDDFITKLADEKIETFIISGNHDSAERLAVGSDIFKHSGIHIAKTLADGCPKVVLEDEEGPIEIHLVPFLKPAHVKAILRNRGEDEVADSIDSYNRAMEWVISSLDKGEENRKILLAHQYITGSEKSESEEQVIGGLDNVDSSLFEEFDYVALGHLHKAQNVNEFVRYCGTPLKYSLSEINNVNSVTIVSFEGKKLVKKYVPLKPLRKLVEIKGSYEEIMKKSFVDNYNLDDYFHIILTDEKDVIDGASKLMTVYKNLVKLSYERHILAAENESILNQAPSMKSPLENVEEFFKLQNESEMSEYQRNLIKKIFDEFGGAENEA